MKQINFYFFRMLPPLHMVVTIVLAFWIGVFIYANNYFSKFIFHEKNVVAIICTILLVNIIHYFIVDKFSGNKWKNIHEVFPFTAWLIEGAKSASMVACAMHAICSYIILSVFFTDYMILIPLSVFSGFSISILLDVFMRMLVSYRMYILRYILQQEIANTFKKILGDTLQNMEKFSQIGIEMSIWKLFKIAKVPSYVVDHILNDEVPLQYQELASAIVSGLLQNPRIIPHISILNETKISKNIAGNPQDWTPYLQTAWYRYGNFEYLTKDTMLKEYLLFHKKNNVYTIPMHDMNSISGELFAFLAARHNFFSNGMHSNIFEFVNLKDGKIKSKALGYNFVERKEN